MVFDDNDGIATGRQLAEHIPENLDILEVEARCRFIEQVDHFLSGFACKFRSKLEALGFTAAEGRHGLAEFHIREAHIAQTFELRQNFRLVLEEFAGFGNAHVEHVGDILALEGDGEGFLIVAFATADIADFPHIGKEVHFYRDGAATFAGLAAAASQVVTEAPVVESFQLGLRQFGEQLADVVKHARVLRGVPEIGL